MFAASLPLKDQPHIDWALIILLYAAVHYVEAYLAKIGIHLSHTARDSYIGRTADLKKCYKEYRDLKYYGFNARYEFCGFKADDFAIASESWEAIKTHLTPFL